MGESEKHVRKSWWTKGKVEQVDCDLEIGLQKLVTIHSETGHVAENRREEQGNSIRASEEEEDITLCITDNRGNSKVKSWSWQVNVGYA